MTFSIAILSISIFLSRTLIWLRLGEGVTVLTCQPMLFSERMGYKKHRKLIGGWRLTFEEHA